MSLKHFAMVCKGKRHTDCNGLILEIVQKQLTFRDIAELWHQKNTNRWKSVTLDFMKKILLLDPSTIQHPHPLNQLACGTNSCILNYFWMCSIFYSVNPHRTLQKICPISEGGYPAIKINQCPNQAIEDCFAQRCLFSIAYFLGCFCNQNALLKGSWIKKQSIKLSLIRFCIIIAVIIYTSEITIT